MLYILKRLFNALDKYVKREAPDNPITDIVGKQPSAEVMKDASKAFDKEAIQFAGAELTNSRPVVQFNNNAPPPLLAHELGHVALVKLHLVQKYKMSTCYES